MKTCKFCAKENLDNAQFCVNCGKDLSSKPLEPLGLDGWLTLIFFIFVICFFVFAIITDALSLKELKSNNIEIVNWHFSGQTVYMDIYNGSDYTIREMSPIILYLYKKGVDCDDDKSRESQLAGKFKFRLALERNNFLKPLNSGSYDINVGAVLESDKYDKKCLRLGITYKGREFF